MAFDEWIERAHGKPHHAPHPMKRVLVSDTAHGYFLTVCRGDKLIERRGPSNSLRYIMKHAEEHCGFSDEPKRPTFVDREEEVAI